MSKGTILYIGGFELPDKNAAAHRVINNAKILQSLGYKVVFIGVNKITDETSNILDSYENYYGFDCYSVDYPKTSKEWLIHLTSINNFFEVYRRYNDIKMVICYNYQSLPMYKIQKKCKKDNVKIISDCTEWYSAKGNGFIFFILKGLDTSIRMRFLNKKTDGVIVISKYLENFYKGKQKIVNIPPLVDASEEKFINNYQKNEEEIELVYAGSPGDQKDKLNIVIEGLSKIKYGFKMNIVGLTKQQYLETYSNDVKMIEELGSKINFVGKVDHLTALYYVKKAHFSCFYRETNIITLAGFPTKFVESITCGTPIITNANSNIRDYLKEGENGYLLDGKSENITNKMNNIFSDLESYKKIQVNTEMFDYKNYMKLLEDFMLEIEMTN